MALLSLRQWHLMAPLLPVAVQRAAAAAPHKKAGGGGGAGVLVVEWQNHRVLIPSFREARAPSFLASPCGQFPPGMFFLQPGNETSSVFRQRLAPEMRRDSNFSHRW